MFRPRVVAGVITLLIAVVVPGVVADQQAAAKPRPAAACGPATFSGSVANMEAFLKCAGVSYKVYTNPGSLATPAARRAAARSIAPRSVECTWMPKHVAQLCNSPVPPYGQFVKCMAWWATSYNNTHCGPPNEYIKGNGTNLWSKIITPSTWTHAATACARGSVAPTAVGFVAKAAGATTGVGVIIAAGGGCLGGLINYYWHFP